MRSRSAIRSGGRCCPSCPAPPWLEIEPNERRGVVRSLPLREDIQIPVTEQLIVELYSK